MPGRGHRHARCGREIGLVDAVVVGLDPTFDFASLAAAATALHAGARLIGTNDDPTFPTRPVCFPAQDRCWLR